MKTLEWAGAAPRTLRINTPIGYVSVMLGRTRAGGLQLDVLTQACVRPADPAVKVEAGADGLVAQIMVSQDVPDERPKDFMPPELALAGNITGKHVILSQDHYAGDTVDRVMRAGGGFGCEARNASSKVYGEISVTGEKIETRRNRISRFASTAECEAAHYRWNQKVNG